MIGSEEREWLAELARDAASTVQGAFDDAPESPVRIALTPGVRDALKNLASTADMCGAQAFGDAVRASFVDEHIDAGWRGWFDAVAGLLGGTAHLESPDELLIDGVNAALAERLAAELTASHGGEMSDDGSAPFPIDDANFEPGDGRTSAAAILSVFAEEIDELRPQIEDTLSQMREADSMLADAGRQECIGLIRRFEEASASLDIQSLTLSAGFLIENLESMEVEKLGELADLVHPWPVKLRNYIEAPDSDTACVELIEHMQLDAWPKPMSDANARTLLDKLTDRTMVFEALVEEDARPSEATDDDVALVIAPEVNPGLVDAFFIEVPDYAGKLVEAIVAISNNDDRASNLEAAQRFTHTIKGAANLVGVAGIANLAHHLEDLLDFFARDKSVPLGRTVCDAFQEAADCIEAMSDALQDGSPPPANARDVLQRVLDLAGQMDTGELMTRTNLESSAEEASAPVPENDPAQTDIFKTSVVQAIPDLGPAAGSAQFRNADEYVRVPRQTIDR
ncbi:MAG: Hpt domain-containing protein, partial [Pseudomonadota bacterium]